MCDNQPQEPCAKECGFIATERNRYFTGKFMTARDFRLEQRYFLSRHRLHNYLFHGWGVVCGLEVIPHGDPECADRWVIVCPGAAIDCRGRELVVHSKTPVQIWKPPAPENEIAVQAKSEQGEAVQQARTRHRQTYDEESTPEQKQPDQQPETPPEGETEQSGPFLLYLRYDQEKTECVPAFCAESTCDPKRREANRVREVARLEVCGLDEVEETGWRATEGDPEARCRDDCADPLPGPAGVCLEPDCPSREMVPLALIQPRPTKEGYIIEKKDIDTEGRRRLPPPADVLTHIVDTNWSHGGEISLSELRDPIEEGGLGGQLQVRFDRKLVRAESPAKREAYGINEFTFVVQFGGVQQDIEFLPCAGPDNVPILEEDCLAVYMIDPDYLRGRQTIANSVVYVTLKCDFILDCHENPVDGNHVGGRLPSGNGHPGGVFESWFRILPDR